MQFHFDPALRRMSTMDRVGTTTIVVHTKGAPEEVLACCTHLAEATGTRPMTYADRTTIETIIAEWARQGRRLLAIAERTLGPSEIPADLTRDQAEQGSTLLGITAMIDPPRPEVPEAVDRMPSHSPFLAPPVISASRGIGARDRRQSRYRRRCCRTTRRYRRE